jgi:hypothetical protein
MERRGNICDVPKVQMDNIREQSAKKPSLSCGRLTWDVGLSIAALLCFIILIDLCLSYRRSQSEWTVTAQLLSKSPNGHAASDAPYGLKDYVYETIGVRKPVTTLFLVGPRITDADLSLLDSLPHLTLLSIEDSPITDNGVKIMTHLQSLRDLTFSGCSSITDQSFPYIAEVKPLRSLSIWYGGKRLSGRNVDCLAVLPNLVKLDLLGCEGVTDDAVEPIISLHQLLEIELRLTSISSNGVSRLRETLPNATIEADD